MTNKEAIEVLQSMKSDFPLPKAAQTRRAQNDALDVAIEALKAEPEPRKGKCLPPAQPEQRWIPVTERPPKKGQKCLVSDKGCIAIDTFWGRGGAYNWQFYTRDYEAWMPLPDAYNTERRTDDVNADA